MTSPPLDYTAEDILQLRTDFLEQCDDADADRAQEWNDAIDSGERPDLWDPPEICVSVPNMRIVLALLADNARMVKVFTEFVAVAKAQGLNLGPIIADAEEALSGASDHADKGSAQSQPSPASPSDCAENGPLHSDGWRDIASAPRDGTTIQARIPGHGDDNMIEWIAGALENERGSCGAWTFVHEDQEPPDCWSDGWCWTVNADGVSSAWPTAWKPVLPAESSPSGAQQSELSRSAQDEPFSPPPSDHVGGEG